MSEYHKIPTVYARDPATNYRTMIIGEFATPELEYLQNNIWEFTEKVDGTNIRVIYKDGLITFGGKNDNSEMPDFLRAKLTEMFLPLQPAFISQFNDAEVCLYGEGYGARIQKVGVNYRRDQSFVLFDIRIGYWWLQRKDVDEIAKKLGLESVPVIGEGTLHDMIAKVKAGFNSQWGDFLSEGIVARPKVELMARNAKRIITKMKHKDFLDEIK
jgi:ATP-dependent RNA circularization protein (DNA/RNA ligase family)